MTIGEKKLSARIFGIILSMVVVLFLVNLSAVLREHAAKAAAAASLKLADSTNAARFQVMQNCLYLSNYLLSGDTREVDRMNDGLRTLNDKLEEGKAFGQLRPGQDRTRKGSTTGTGLGQGILAQPLIDKRKDVDSGNATVAELQIYYLQKDASAWVKNFTDALNVADSENHNLVEERRASDTSAANWTIGVSLISTLIALCLGVVIAYRTAGSITQPLIDLMSVARGIGNTGDLEHNIDLGRDDEIGELARTFHKMVTYLKEMAGVSESIAGGDLTLEVTPRSSHDTLGNAFARMRDGLRAGALGARCRRRRWPAVPTRSPTPPRMPPRSACSLLRPSMRSPAPCTR